MKNHLSPPQNRINILNILKSKGPLTYNELQSLSGFKTKKENGKFAYHFKKLRMELLLAQNESEEKYKITSLGELFLHTLKMNTEK